MSLVASRSLTVASRDGSRTMVMTDTQPRTEDATSSTQPEASTIGTLKLRGGPRNRQRVAWVEDTVDNEGMGRKKTKICCIYHRPKRFDESSDEESSDSDSDSDGGASSAPLRARPTNRHRHHHHHGAQNTRDPQGSDVHVLESDKDDRNAYEGVPRPSKGKGKAT